MHLTNKDIILVDDGIATSSTIKSAVQALKQRNVRKIIIAAPVASADSKLKLIKEVDQLVILSTPTQSTPSVSGMMTLFKLIQRRLLIF